MFSFRQKSKGFTLIELLVVIAIIALLSSVVLTSLGTARAKSRDAKRFSDMRELTNALRIYQDRYGCIPMTSPSNTCGVAAGKNTADTGLGGWDYSSHGTFMNFLTLGSEPIMREVPVDPINDMPGDNTPGTYAYKYYCYPGFGLALGYWKENPTRVAMYSTIYRDPDFLCQ